MTVLPAGSINTNSLNVPDLYVQIQPPNNAFINGIPTNIIGMVGTASWGPVNSPITVSNINEYIQNFGPVLTNKYDMGTHVAAAVLQYANNIQCVRVTDDTDTSAVTNILDTVTSADITGIVLTAYYTGTVGNTIVASITKGSNYTVSAPTFKLTIVLPNGLPEVFDNIGGTGAALWQNMVDAVNLGQSGIRGPSQLCIASLGTGIGSGTVGVSGSYTSIPTLSFSGGGGTGAAASLTMKALVPTAIAAAGTGYAPADTVTLAGGTFTTNAVLSVSATELVSAALNAAGTGYAPADTITLAGGTFSAAAVLTVSKTKLVSAAINAGGSGYANGDTVTLSGGTFTSAAVVTVDSVDGGGAILTFSISTAGSYSVNSTSFTQDSTSGSGTGATFNTGLFGVDTFTVSTAGVYTANTSSFTQGSTSGSGTGAIFNTALYGIQACTVSVAGNYSAIPSNPVSQTSSSGSGTGATFTMAWGLLGVVITASGSGYTSAPTATVSSGLGTVTVTVGSTNLPIEDSYTFTGGTNGITSVDAQTLLGLDTVPRSGMYALRNTGASIIDLCDNDDSTTYSAQVSYGLYEGAYMIMVGPAGQSITAAIDAKRTAGIDSYAAKLLYGDWIYWQDSFNNQLRLISPQGFASGILSQLSPENSSLNKPLYGIVGTQKTYANQVYSNADLGQLANNGLDVITNPSPGGNYFSVRIGHNTSSNAVIHGDNYTRLTNYIAFTFNAVMGKYVGMLQTVTERLNAKNTLQAFLANMQQQGMIGSVNGGPAFQVTLDATNNPSSRVALGYQQADVKVVYLSVIEYFVINVEGGQSVQIQRLATVPQTA